MSRSIKYWLIGTILILAIYVVIFLFRKYLAPIYLLWVMALTPFLWLALLFLPSDFSALTRKE
jgi:hypothetical protein